MLTKLAFGPEVARFSWGKANINARFGRTDIIPNPFGGGPDDFSEIDI